MAKNIVIVESPAKGKTIEEYLGSDYQVIASYGHVRDLPKGELGVDVDHQFLPKYIIPTKSRQAVTALKTASAKADLIYLATDFDREGEAIAWHVTQAINLSGKNQSKIKRITFHEITKTALLEAIKNPRSIDLNLVNAQQARRILDRLVGYKLSPFLWKKVASGLSAGRVQSVAVRLIVDREREIEKFKPQEYWSVEGKFTASESEFWAKLTIFQGKSQDKMTIISEELATNIIRQLKSDQFVISDILHSVENKFPSPPFTTSTLQQTANYQLHFSSKQTMKLAQDLYEAGLITYMRTDSTNVANLAVTSARKYIENQYGKVYLSNQIRVYKTKTKGAQEAHEAIRPTSPDKNVDQIKGRFDDRHLKLYDLIWKRLIASQMAEAKLDKIMVKINGNQTQSVFSAHGQKIKFAGFLKVYPIVIEEKEIPDLKIKENVKLTKLKPDQHFTQPPPRYTEATLIKTLEENGIGRPSTYVPTISTIIDRGYVTLESRVFHPQEIGIIVTDLLKEHFPNIVDVNFTAALEDELDKVAEGKEKWTEPLTKFWQPFAKLLEEKFVEVDKKDLTKDINEACPQCQKPLVERLGKYGRFVACSGFPSCKYARQIIVDTQIKCPDCDKGTLVERRTKKGGRLFWGCGRYPECKYATWNDPRKNKINITDTDSQPS